MLRQRGLHEIRKVPVGKRTPGDVDGQVGFRPLDKRFHRPRDHEPVELRGLPGSLDRAHECRRVHGRAIRAVRQAEQDLVAQDRTADRRDDRLEINPERAVLHGVLDPGRPVVVRDQRLERAAGFPVKLHAVPAPGLRGIAGGIRHAEDIVGLPRPIDGGDADRGLDAERPPLFGKHQVLEIASQPLADIDRVRDRTIRQDDHEFIPAETHQDVLRPDRVAEDVRHGEKEPVARLVAERVVDDLEVVEIDVEQRAHPPGPRFGHRLSHRQRKAPPVEKLRQRIVVGKEFEVVFQLPALRDVLHRSLGHGQADIEEARMIRLPDVIIRARIEDFLEVVGTVVSRAGEDVVVFPLRVFSQAAAEIQPAHSGELNIQDDERKKRLSEKVSGLFGGFASVDIVPASPDHPFQKEPCRAVILDDQNLERSPRRIDRVGQFQGFR